MTTLQELSVAPASPLNQEDEVIVSSEELEEIKAKVEKLKKTLKLRKITPIIVEGTPADSKPRYVGYFKEPEFKAFSRFQSAMGQDALQANRMLAADCFVDGDKELIEDDSMFMFGTMPQLDSLIVVRKSRIVNL